MEQNSIPVRWLYIRNMEGTVKTGMKKYIGWLLIMALLLMAGGSLAQDEVHVWSEFLDTEIYATVTGITPEDMTDDITIEIADGERVIYVMSPYISGWIVIPADGPAEDAYNGNAVCFVLDEASLGEMNASDPIDSSTWASRVLRPVSLEVFGALYGIVEATTETTLSVLLSYDCELGKVGETVDIALSENTMGYKGDYPYEVSDRFWEIFQPGDGCMVIFDNESHEVVQIQEANG